MSSQTMLLARPSPAFFINHTPHFTDRETVASRNHKTAYGHTPTMPSEGSSSSMSSKMIPDAAEALCISAELTNPQIASLHRRLRPQKSTGNFSTSHIRQKPKHHNIARKFAAMLQNNSISASRHSPRREELRAINRRRITKTRPRREHMQRRLPPIDQTFRSSREIILTTPCKVQDPSHLLLVLPHHLIARSIALI